MKAIGGESQAQARSWRTLLLIVLVAVWLASLTLRPLYKPDEARYGEIAREMAQSGDWITPRLNGFKYFEKPPLQYWVSALALKVLGERDWAVRLWPGLMTLCGVALVFLAARRLFTLPAAGGLAAAILASCPLYVVLGQVCTLDMGVSVFLSAAIFAFAIAQTQPADPRSQRRWMLAAWAASALAVLSKGLIGLALPAAGVALYILVRRDWALLRRLELARGALLFSAITAPWFVAVSLRNPEFARFFFVQEHWLRFTTTMHHRVEPAWYFLPVLAVGLGPWLLPVAAGWARSARSARGGAGFSPDLFLALWALVVIAFFSASGSKLAAYILPMFPALAVLAGVYLAEAPRSGLLCAQCLLLAACGAVLGTGQVDELLARDSTLAPLAEAYRPWLSMAALMLVAAGMVGAASAALRGSAARCIAAGTLAALLVAGAGHRVFAPAFSVSPLLDASQPLAQQARFYAVDTYDHTMPWSLRRTVTMVVYKDELSAPIEREPGEFLPDFESFRRAWRAPGEAYAFLALRDFDRLRVELDLPIQEVARGPRYVLVRKP